ncbi:MAG: hypothetical protein LBH48_06900 [Bifidobacteriaceae bacterium]|nr:hypothetical protein [Bifidobacteriaceae bacterium]
MGLLHDCVDLLVPWQCAGCQAPGPALCPECRKEFFGPVRRCESGAPRLVPADAGPSLPVWTRATYAGPARDAIGEWKRRGRADLTPLFAQVMAGIGREIAPGLARLGLVNVAVVPVPSRLVSRLRRGIGLTAVLAEGLAAGLSAGGVECQVTDCLRRAAGSRDQVGLAARARSANREGTTEVRVPQSGAFPAMPAVLVDDVVTTGASLLDGERALARAGIATPGAAVLAATPASGTSLEGTESWV